MNMNITNAFLEDKKCKKTPTLHSGVTPTERFVHTLLLHSKGV